MRLIRTAKVRLKAHPTDDAPGLTGARPTPIHAPMSHAPETRPKRRHPVFTLLVQVGRRDGDGLPPKATGAALVCYAAGVDEAEAVRETVAVLKQADLAPLDVTGYGTLEDRLAEGAEIGAEDRALMDRAAAENAVIVAQVDTHYD